LIETFLESQHFYPILRVVIAVTIGLALAYIVRSAAGRILAPRVSLQHAMLGQRAAYYVVLAVTLLGGLRELGVDFTVLLGAAGVATVAIGFASQTSASNLISGLFLISEQPFVIGEVIRVGDTTGEVISIDLLSVKLRTFDNLLVRVPNESLIKVEITNLSRFPIRRYDLQVGVAYKEHIGRVREVLLAVADRNPLCLREPKPQIIFQGFGDSAVNLQFSVWAARENYLLLRNSMAEQVKETFDEAGIEIPFPHRSLYAGSQTEPLPITIVSTSDAARGELESEPTPGP
jgi:small-conductance mechanosensitive channel